MFFIECSQKNIRVELKQNKIIYSVLNNEFMNSDVLSSSNASSVSKCFDNRIDSDWSSFTDYSLTDDQRENNFKKNDSIYRRCAVNALVPLDPSNPPSSDNQPYYGPVPSTQLLPIYPFTDSISCQELIGLVSGDDFSLLNLAIKESFNSNYTNYYQLTASERYNLIVQKGDSLYGDEFNSMFLFFKEDNGSYLPVKANSNPLANIAYLESVTIDDPFPYGIIKSFVERPSDPIIITEFPLMEGEPLPDKYYELWGPYKVLINNSTPSDSGAVDPNHT